VWVQGPHGVETFAHGVVRRKVEGLAGELFPGRRRQLLAQIPLARFCKPEELAHAARFLVSPLAGFITGELLDVNGGVVMD
jgi:3-oxoacyl-[acyl-carrier protein] reductase